MFREVALQPHARKIAPVETSIGPTFVRELTAGERDDMEAEFRKDGKLRCRVVMLSCCTEDGHLEFSNQDLPAIDALPSSVTEPIFDAAMALNKTGLADVEQLRKN